MAFSISALQLMADTLFKDENGIKGKSCCILGFPEISKTKIKILENIFNRKIDECSFHGILRSYGYTDIKVLDFSNYQGAEIIHNLNDPLPDKVQKFDLVIDNGTIEHCFNVGQAMMNIANLCKNNGKIFHLNPANWFGHGFWNFNPCTYFDFYGQNGFDVKVYLRDIPAGSYEEIKYNPHLTKILPSKRYTTHAIAIRKELKELKYPMQSRYV
jgi:SAM-dependent methyltransferase